MRAAFLVLAIAWGSAQACGYCVEDKIAAVYDHASISRARAAKHQVAFDGSVRFYFMQTYVKPDHLVRRAVRAEDARDLMNRKANADREEADAFDRKVRKQMR